LNYSRSYGSAPTDSAKNGTYNVWCYLATSGTGAQAAFSQVMSDPTQGSQTTNFIGNFGTASFSDNSFNNFVYVPLVDQFGNRISLTISNGVQTYRSLVVGNPNLGYYMLMPVAPVFTPTFLNVYPDGSLPFQTTNHLTFTVGPAQGAAIATNGIQLIVNGVDVTAGVTYSVVSGVFTVTYPVQSNAVYSAVINVTNTGGLGTSFSFNFDTFDANNFQWEAVDYNYSTNDFANNATNSGLFIDNALPNGDSNLIPNNGTLQANGYWGYPGAFTPGNDGVGSFAAQGIDINWPTNTTQGQSQANAMYRFVDLVGSQIATDYLRPKFLIAQTNTGDTLICPYNIGFLYASNWLNYTRTFPTNTYNIWIRAAAGTGPFRNAKLSRVTSGATTPNQTLSDLGTFTDLNPVGWQSYHTVPLLDANGNKVVVPLGGVETLRFTAPTNASPASGALNVVYFMLTPAPAVAAPFTISAKSVGGVVQISIPTQNGFSYQLYSAGSLPATSWTPVGASIPGDGTTHTVNPPTSGIQGYYRVLPCVRTMKHGATLIVIS
jgi:hypothetical protein